MRKVIPSDAILIPASATCVFEGVIYDVYQWEQANYDAGERITAAPKTFDEFQMLVNQSTGFLGSYRNLVEHLKSADDIKNLPEFSGQSVDR